MGIEPFLVASSVVAVLAQRLLRQVCSDCKQPYHPTDEELIRLGIVPPRVRPTFYRGAGCPACAQTGYRGRTGIFELLVLDDEIRRLIGNKADSASIRQAAMAKGMVTLKDDGAEKVFSRGDDDRRIDAGYPTGSRDLARINHEHFCCNRLPVRGTQTGRSAATRSLRRS